MITICASKTSAEKVEIFKTIVKVTIFSDMDCPIMACSPPTWS
jgi:hypothetical protein